MRHSTHSLLLLSVLAACGGTPKAPSEPISSLAREVAAQTEVAGARRVDAYRVYGPKDLLRLPELAEGEYRVHMIDVGTGLAILVQGKDFNLLYDGGSADDREKPGRDHKHSRLNAYLWGALGRSGPARCRPEGDGWHRREIRETVIINHVVLSHPHTEHANMLDDVLDCYAVENVWDTGVDHHATAYRRFWEGIAREPDVHIHTVAAPPAGRKKRFARRTVRVPRDLEWSRFGEGEVERLGLGAEFRVLYADAGDRADRNENTLVLRVELGGTSLLLMGDAESGPRNSPRAPADGAEAYLLANYRDAIDVDILQVAQHGSSTGSRDEFLRAVSPSFALVSAGPTEQYGESLPHPLVVQALNRTSAMIARTDEHDGRGCPVYDRFGANDDGPGGCDNYVFHIGPERNDDTVPLPPLLE